MWSLQVVLPRRLQRAVLSSIYYPSQHRFEPQHKSIQPNTTSEMVFPSLMSSSCKTNQSLITPSNTLISISSPYPVLHWGNVVVLVHVLHLQLRTQQNVNRTFWHNHHVVPIWIRYQHNCLLGRIYGVCGRFWVLRPLNICVGLLAVTICIWMPPSNVTCHFRQSPIWGEERGEARPRAGLFSARNIHSIWVGETRRRKTILLTWQPTAHFSIWLPIMPMEVITVLHKQRV